MPDNLDELRQRATRLTAVLENNWGEDFVEALYGDKDAALGFALARAITQGWVNPVPAAAGAFGSAESFAEDQVGDDDDDE